MAGELKLDEPWLANGEDLVTALNELKLPSLWVSCGDSKETCVIFCLASFDFFFFRRISSVTKLTSQMLMKFLIVSMSQTALELCCAGNLVYKSHSANTIRRRRGTRESGSREPFLTGRIVQRLRGSLPQKRKPKGHACYAPWKTCWKPSQVYIQGHSWSVKRIISKSILRITAQSFDDFSAAGVSR